ncbi:MAG: D-alanyl-D-alanine carboxypeptidase family protein [Planifilum sp.]|jgi:D-alanyl-D-alanine carboxypeptidase (penicillin-binding protein 5/6)
MHLTSIRFAVVLLLIPLLLGNTKALASPPGPEVSARSAALLDVASGRLLYEKDAHRRMPIASVTKIMTAIVAIEHGNLSDRVRVSSRAEGVEGSSIYLKAGEKIPLEHLLYGLMLRSGNDAAVAIAEHVGGSVEGFVYMMNEKAEYLGLSNTHFANPHGLDHPDHYSTAADLARLTAYAMRNSTFRKIVSTEVKTVPWPGETWHRKWYNKNKMLRYYRWADGVKTGYTKQARRTLVSSANRDGRRLVSVTLNAPDDWNDSMRLLEFGYREFSTVQVVKKGQVFDWARVAEDEDRMLQAVAAEGFAYPLSKDERNQIRLEPVVTHPLDQIEEEGKRVGNIRVYLEDELVGTVPLLTQFAESPSVWRNWSTVLQYVFGRGG